MQTFILSRKRLSLFLSMFSIICVVILFSSCKNFKNKETSPETFASNGASSFKMNCVILTKAQVQAWVDSGWTNPANSYRIKNLLFQFYSENTAYINKNMQLITYPGPGLCDVMLNAKADTLKIDTTCVPKTISGNVVFGNTTCEFDSLKITDVNGSLINFDFIRLRPAQTHPPYIDFDIEIVTNGVIYSKTKVWPCPIYCCPGPNCPVN